MITSLSKLMGWINVNCINLQIKLNIVYKKAYET